MEDKPVRTEMIVKLSPDMNDMFERASDRAGAPDTRDFMVLILQAGLDAVNDVVSGRPATKLKLPDNFIPQSWMGSEFKDEKRFAEMMESKTGVRIATDSLHETLARPVTSGMDGAQPA